MKLKRQTLLTADHLILILLLIIGGAVRVHSAWRYRHMINLDAGVVALMAKHMVEGLPWPAFFYGQPHMGSLEALFSALFCRIFGVSGFAVNLGTALVSFGLLPVVYFWGKDLAGKRAGQIAVAFLCVGPGGFYHYNGSPRGGYAAALTFGAFVLFYATRMCIRWAETREQRARDFFLLGIGAGLAWWSSQLTTAALLSAALLLLCVLRARAFTCRIFCGLLGFLLGSLPLWLYNLRNDWATFQFTGSFGRVPFRSALLWFFRDRSRGLMIPTWLPDWGQMLLILAYLLLCAGWVWMLVSAVRSRNARLVIGLGGLAMFTLIFAGMYASAHFAKLDTPRYFLPMVAPLGLVLATALVTLSGRLLRLLGGLSAAVLILVTGWGHLSRNPVDDHAALHANILEIGEEAAAKEVRYLHAFVHYRSWSFITGERIRIVDVWNEVYEPYAIAAEFEEGYAALNNYGGIQSFLDSTGGRSGQFHKRGHQVHYGFQPPPPPGPAVSPGRIHSLRDSRGDDLRDVLLSGRLGRILTIPRGTPEIELVWELGEALPLSGVRLWGGSPHMLPGAFQLEGQTVDGSWVQLLEQEGMTGYFWSGPRPFWALPFHRFELRFPARDLRALRLRVSPRTPDHTFQFQHADLLLAGAVSDDNTPISELHRILKKQGIHTVYADRWESLRIHERSGGRIRTVLRNDLFPDSLSSTPASLGPGAAVLSRQTEQSRIRETLERRGGVVHVIPLPPYSLLHLEDTLDTRGLEWNGLFFFENPSLQALQLLERGETDRALALYPELQAPPMPQAPLDIRFRNGVRLHEFRMETEGNILRMHALWEIPPRIDPDRLAVFVHFRDVGGVRFQDDHVLLEDIPLPRLIHRPPHNLFPVVRELRLPADLPSGGLELHIGMYERRNGHRVPVRTRLPQRRHAVRLPVPGSTNHE